MVIVVNSDAEEASVWAAMDVIRTLRGHAKPIQPDTRDTELIRTRWANESYL